MGTPNLRQASAGDPAPLRAFYTDKAWIDGQATLQAEQTAHLPGMQQLALFPDLHAGKYGPVGMAALVDRLYPTLVGNDLGCGMALFKTDLKAHKVKVAKAAKALEALEGPDPAQKGRDFRLGLGTIGGGNHFCELLTVEALYAPHDDVAAKDLVCLVHSGSRGFATANLLPFMTSGEALDPRSEDGRAYLDLHDRALVFAARNRAAIAARASLALRCSMELICDVPHNEVAQMGDGALLHRKGAARAVQGLVPLAGSRDTHSYLLEVGDTTESLNSLSHGAGRKYDRASMHGRVGKTKSDLTALTRNPFGGQIVCGDRNLLKEESGRAYKDAAQVVADLSHFGLARPIAKLRPLVTFKTTGRAG